MWYHNKPIKFECQPGCGKCCLTSKGEYGTVTYHHTDVEKLSADDKKELIWVGRANTKKPGYWEQPTSEKSQCMFLEDIPFVGGMYLVHLGGDKECGIHKNKPKPCAAYPFWPSIMESEDKWNKEAEFCPGIGKGDIVPVEEIKQKLDGIRDYPNLEKC